jgi:hypothetical protein
MRDIILQLGAKFTAAEKEQRIDVIDQMVRYVNDARRRGVLGLESELENADTDVLDIGLYMMIECKEKDEVEEELRDIIIKGNYTGYDLLKRIITTEGILKLMDGINPIKMAEELTEILSHDGEPFEGYTKAIKNAKEAETWMSAYYDMRKKLNDAKWDDEKTGLESMLRSYGDHMWYVIELADAENLVKILHRCAKNYVYIVIDNTTLERVYQLSKLMDFNTPPSDAEIDRAVEELQNEAKKILEERNELL